MCSGDCTNIGITTATSFIKACWDGFSDNVAGLAGFWSQIVDVDLKREYDQQWHAAEGLQGNPVILVQKLSVRFLAAGCLLDN